MRESSSWICAGFVVLIAAMTFILRIRNRRIAATRTGDTFEKFANSFSEIEAAPEVIRLTYLKLQEWMADSVDAFPVRADDDIGRVYGMVDTDLELALIEVIDALGRELPAKAVIERMTPIDTVQDFVRVVQACPLKRT